MTSANLSSHKQFERSVPAKYAYPETPLEIFELIGKEFGIYSDWIAECADKYGCNIRLLVMGREGAQDVVNSALGRWSPKIMMDIMDDNNLTPSHTSNPAVLITPRVDDSTSENEDPLALQRRYKFLTASWDFASAHVRLQVQDKHAEQLLDIARSVCQDKDKGAKAEWAIPAILAAGGEFTVRKFVDKDFTTDTITLDAAKLIYGSSVSGSDTAKIDDVLSSCKDPNAWYCFNGTFPLFDLFRPPYMFVNSTVNANHKTHYGLAAHLVEKCPGAEMFYATPRVVFDKINQMPTFWEVRVNNAKDVMQNSYVFWNLPDEQKLKLKNWKVHTLCVTQKRQFSTSARVSSVLRFPIMSAFAVPASTLPALSGAVLRGCMRLLKKL